MTKFYKNPIIVYLIISILIILIVAVNSYNNYKDYNNYLKDMNADYGDVVITYPNGTQKIVSQEEYLRLRENQQIPRNDFNINISKIYK